MKNKYTQYLYPAGLLAAVSLLGFHEIWDRDIFFHIANGQALLTHGVPLPENIFVWARSELPFYQNPAWLFGLLLALVHAVAGLGGVVILKCLLLLLLYFALYRYLIGEKVAPALAAMTLFLVAMASSLRMNERPEIFTFLFFALLVWLVQNYRNGSDRFIRWLPLLLALWANLHSGVIFGLLYLLLVLGGECVALLLAGRGSAWLGETTLSRQRLGRFALLVALAALATLLTPDPLGNYRFLFQHLHVTKVVPVAEYGFPTLTLVPWFYGLLAPVIILLLFRPRLFPFATILPAAAFLLLAFAGVRFIPLFAVAVLPLLASRLAGLSQEWERKPRWAINVVIPLLLVAIPALWPPVPGRHEISVNRTQTPLAAFRFLKAHQLKGHLYNSMSLGAAGMYYLYPQYRLYQSSYIQVEEDRQSEAHLAAKDPQAWQAFLDRHHIDIALIDIKYEEPSPVFFPTEAWALVFFDDVAAVYLRRSGANEAVIAAQEYRVIHPARILGGDGVQIDRYNYQQGFLELQRAREWSPDSFLVHLLLGYQYNAVPGQEVEALQHFTRAGELNPSVAAADFQRGLLLIELGRPAEAVEILKSYLRSQPTDPLGYLYFAKAQHASGDADAAIKSLRQGLKRVEGKSALRHQLGNLLRDRGELDAALVELQSAAQSEPMNPVLLNDLGVCLGMKGDLRGALTIFERALSIQPDSTEIVGNREQALQQLRGEP